MCQRKNREKLKQSQICFTFEHTQLSDGLYFTDGMFALLSKIKLVEWNCWKSDEIYLYFSFFGAIFGSVYNINIVEKKCAQHATAANANDK